MVVQKLKTTKLVHLNAGVTAGILMLPGTTLAASADLRHNPIVTEILQPAMDFLSAVVGIVIIANIIVGGIQYSMAGGNAQDVTKAKQRIINALITFLGFIFAFALLQWFVPGGIFN